MGATEYFETVNNIADKIISASNMDILKMDEQEKQIMGAFCFGVLNGYSLETKVSAVQVQGAMIGVLVRNFQYDSDVAAQFCEFLIRCTEKNFHPTMNVIIHRGIEGYYQLENKEILKNNILEIIRMVKKYKD